MFENGRRIFVKAEPKVPKSSKMDIHNARGSSVEWNLTAKAILLGPQHVRMVVEPSIRITK
jgi:hypothetical protein